MTEGRPPPIEETLKERERLLRELGPGHRLMVEAALAQHPSLTARQAITDLTRSGRLSSTQTGTDRASDERERKLSKLSRRNRDLVQRVMVRHPLLTVEEAIEVADVGRHIGSLIVIAVVAVAAVVVVLKTQDGRGQKISTGADIRIVQPGQAARAT